MVTTEAHSAAHNKFTQKGCETCDRLRGLYEAKVAARQSGLALDFNGQVVHGLVVDTDSTSRVEIRSREGGYLVCAAARERAARSGAASHLIDTRDLAEVIVLRRGSGKRFVTTVTGPAVLWAYGDEHGREVVAVLRRGLGFVLTTAAGSTCFRVAGDGRVAEEIQR